MAAKYQIAIADFRSKARAATLDKVKLASGDAIAAQLRCADRFFSDFEEDLCRVELLKLHYFVAIDTSD